MGKSYIDFPMAFFHVQGMSMRGVHTHDCMQCTAN